MRRYFGDAGETEATRQLWLFVDLHVSFIERHPVRGDTWLTDKWSNVQAGQDNFAGSHFFTLGGSCGPASWTPFVALQPAGFTFEPYTSRAARLGWQVLAARERDDRKDQTQLQAKPSRVAQERQRSERANASVLYALRAQKLQTRGCPTTALRCPCCRPA